MQQQTDNFAKFGKSFQDSLCQLMLEDRPFCDQITEVLTIDFLETKYLQVFVKTIMDYRTRYNVHPTYEILATIFKSGITEYDDAVQKQVRDYYARVIASDKVNDSDYIKQPLISAVSRFSSKL